MFGVYLHRCGNISFPRCEHSQFLTLLVIYLRRFSTNLLSQSPITSHFLESWSVRVPHRCVLFDSLLRSLESGSVFL